MRVHPEILDAAAAAAGARRRSDIWKQRFEDIDDFERYAARNGIAIRKFFLHVSKEEQKRRFLRAARRTRARTGSSRSADVAGARALGRVHAGLRGHDPAHQRTPHAPWYVVPADNKWFTRLVVGAAVIDAMEEMALAFPKVNREKRKELVAAHAALAGASRAAGSRKHRA